MSDRKRPKFVWCVSKTNESRTALRLISGTKYFRDCGNWECGSRWKGDVLLSIGPPDVLYMAKDVARGWVAKYRTKPKPMEHLTGCVLVPCTREEWFDDNGGNAETGCYECGDFRIDLSRVK